LWCNSKYETKISCTDCCKGTPYLFSIQRKGRDILTLFAGTEALENEYENKGSFEREVIDDLFSDSFRIMLPLKKILPDKRFHHPGGVKRGTAEPGLSRS